MKNETAWDHLQARDLERFGREIADPALRRQWGRAFFLAGTLPYLWNVKLAATRREVFDALDLVGGDRVFLLGEAIAACRFEESLRERIGPGGEIHSVEIIDEARDRYFRGERGPSGALAQWRYPYMSDLPDASFDAVAILQGVQHTDDWRASGSELGRILKPGGVCLLAEITLGGEFLERARADVHIDQLLERIEDALGWRLDEFGYYSRSQLEAAFAQVLVDTEFLEDRGLEVFWGRKPL